MYWADAASSFGIGPLNPVSLQYMTHEVLVGMIREVQSVEVFTAARSLQAREAEEQASSLAGEHILPLLGRHSSFAGCKLFLFLTQPGKLFQVEGACSVQLLLLSSSFART